MESTNGKLRLVLRSEKVLARIEEFQVGGVCSNSLMAWNGQLVSSRRTARVYEYVFDERQTRALNEARELARRTGLTLEVTDLTRQSPLRKIFRLRSGGIGREESFGPGQSTGASKDVRGSEEMEEVSSRASRP